MQASFSSSIVRRRVVVALAIFATSVAATALVESPSAATLRPQGLSAASRTCAANTATTSWATTSTAFNTVATCVWTSPTTGTMYLAASASVVADSNGATGTAQMEFDLAGDDAAPIARSQRLIEVHSDTGNGSNVQLTTQTAISVGPGSHSFTLVGRRNAGPATPIATDAQISGYFIPAAETAASCISPDAGVITVAATDVLTVAQCSVTVPAHGTIHLLASTGVGEPSTGHMFLHATIDGGPSQMSVLLSKTYPDNSTEFSIAAQSAAGMASGTHTIRLEITAADDDIGVLRHPSISSIFVADTSDTAACNVNGTNGTSSDFSWISVSPICALSVSRPAVLQATATANLYWGSPDPAYEAEFELKLNGVVQTNTERYLDIYAGQSRMAVVQLSVPVGIGSYNVELFARRNSLAGTLRYQNVALIVRAVADAAVIDPPDTAPSTTTTTPVGGGGSGGGGGGGVVDYVPVVPDRVLDTRVSSQVGYTGAKPSAGQVVELTVTGAGSSQVPANAAAVAINVTGTGADAPGYVTVWPCGSAQPTASNLNLVPGVTSPNLVVAKIGTNGKVCLFTQSSADLIADVNGYMPAGSRYVPVIPERLLETRPGSQTGYTGGKPAPGSTVVLHVTSAGATQVPANAKAVVLNVTATAAESAGFVTVWPCGSPRPTASNLNIAVGGTAPNLVISKVGDGGTVCIYTQPAVHLLADVNGYLPADSSYTPVVPERLLETRPEGQVGYAGAQPAAGATIELTVVGVGATQVPAGTSAVVLNVTGVGPDADGFVTVWPCGAPRQTASNLNLAAGGIVPNLVMTKVGDGGKVCIFTQPPTNIVADLSGYWP